MHQHEGLFFFTGYKTIVKVSDVCVLGWLLPGCASRSGKCFADDQRGSRLSSLGQRLHLLEKRRGTGGKKWVGGHQRLKVIVGMLLE